MKPEKSRQDQSLWVIIILFVLLIGILCAILCLAAWLAIERPAGSITGFPDLQQPTAKPAVAPLSGDEGTGALVDFELPDLQGSPVGLSEFLGRPVWINFWATWCPPCVQELPLLQRAHEVYGTRLVVLAVNSAESAFQVTDFLDRYDYSFTVLLDEDSLVSDRFHIQALPTSLFLDADGQLLASAEGSLSWDELQDYLLLMGIEP